MLNMFQPLTNFASAVSELPATLLHGTQKVLFSPIRSYIDDNWRAKVTPTEGSVLYSDLYTAFEHSGIYVGDGQISNIVVDSLLQAESTVRYSTPENFTDKSGTGIKIYVSCDKNGAVGDYHVAEKADSEVGERYFYGLIFSNCHVFSKYCVEHAQKSTGLLDKVIGTLKNLDITEEKTIRELKATARKKLGATKWLLWDLDADSERTPEPDWQTIQQALENQALTPEFIQQLRQELAELKDYQQEITDENIPAEILQKLANYGETMQDVREKYADHKDFLQSLPEASFSYNQLKQLETQMQSEDFQRLAHEMQQNTAIKELARKMGRNYISEDKKKQIQLPEASKSEVHGTHKSDDVMRLLSSELVNMDDDTLEMLFYARLMEQGLLTYELSGITYKQGETTENQAKRTGPVVACLDTSGSMAGTPLLKAKASLLAIANILKKEQRSLHVLLFSDVGQIKECALHGGQDIGKLLVFLNQGYGGGTDFESPLKRAWEIIETEKDYIKADVLMLSDGDCNISNTFNTELQAKKYQLDFSVYSVLCNGTRVSDDFSDDIVVL